MKLAALALSLSALGLAPMQCGSSREGDLRLEDTAGDALWDLALTFEKEGNVAGRDRTLRYLIARYPSNRYADPAREKLGEAPRQ